ncbi:metal-dependent phosphoesterase [Methanocella sp. CWC-04]|uniref:Metal-dependent phosphoesterase n=1 Tax=Methanooceanicella nereidis TaxID=2052831 RepID=A0AAP2RAS2_9EURY|nr:PHP domain-containing protein [Methanocella sp. CWC-04]MCD1293724.1 metal-dependent phosphoesterase [Methanocella sp. CWC-04]
MKVDMHIHTNKSDGRDSVHNIIEAAEKKGLDLIALTDHGPGHGSGVTEKMVSQTKKEVELLQPSYHVKVLVGIEAEILSTGEVYLATREDMDIVLASYHGAPSEEVYYKAVLKALEDEKVDVLAHHAWSMGMRFGPILEYEDMLVEVLRDNDVAIEINSKHTLPSWDFLVKCRDAGIKYTIGSDAHKVVDVGSVSWANNTARHIFKNKGLFIP